MNRMASIPGPEGSNAGQSRSGPEHSKDGSGLFRQHGAAESRNWKPWLAALTVVLLLLFVLVLVGRRDRAQQPARGAGEAVAGDPYASSLALDNIHMSQAENFAGGKVTYVDGNITNKGTKVVTGLTVQLTFNNDVSELPQRLTAPLTLISRHEPYIDTEHVSADPVQPGGTKEFRLTLEGITPIWNQQFPQLTVIHVEGH